MPTLQIVTPEGSRTIDLPSGRITLGRQSDNDVIIKDERSSRHHCVLEPATGGYTLRDLDSRNGTRVRGRRIRETFVAFGEAFSIGKTTLRVFEESLPVAQPADPAETVVEEESVPVAEIVEEPLVIAEAPADEEPLTPERLLANARRDLNSLRTAGTDPGFPIEAVTLVDCHGKPVHTAARGDTASEAVRTLRLLYYGAFRTRATDLHFDPIREGYQVRFRVDGKMLPVVILPEAVGRGVLGVVKALSELDIAGRKNIQDGSFSVQVGRHVDVRVSFTPTHFGEKLVLRVLDTAVLPAHLGDLGLTPMMLKQIRGVCHLDAGMIIVSGPTGSGKTTTLYTCIKALDWHTRNVVTIEDPIEYHMDGITQIQVEAKKGRDFHDILKSVLRQDPDVILVGEIRDHETAKTALQAAMTGHLVFTTLHARDSIGSVFRLLDLGVEPYMIANSVSICLAQRLVRVLCPHCKRPYRPRPSQLIAMKMENKAVDHLYTQVGCRRCLGVGYWGRAAIFELLHFNDQLRDALMTTRTIHDIRRAAGEFTYQTLVESGYRKVLEGL
ncbi:MAG: Flp pilus assembly complex ATPase component TadA, partial [Phycisphaerae bacterium]